MATHWSGLTVFVQHAHVPMHNNVAERDARRAVVERKNSCPRHRLVTFVAGHARAVVHRLVVVVRHSVAMAIHGAAAAAVQALPAQTRPRPAASSQPATQDDDTPISPGKMKLWLITYLPILVVPERSNWMVARSLG